MVPETEINCKLQRVLLVFFGSKYGDICSATLLSIASSNSFPIFFFCQTDAGYAVEKVKLDS